MTPADAAARQRLHETFAALCRIESPSGNERECADWVIRELREMELAVDEDDAGPAAAANAGNLFVRIPVRSPAQGRGAGAPAGETTASGEAAAPPSLLLCAHLDTVPPTAAIEPILQDGGWVNANAGILGADNKAAVAVLLELARLFARGGVDPPATVELLFTVSEENGLHGAKAFDTAKLQSKFGYVFDHASPIGEIVIASPTYSRISVQLLGRAAHAGIRPEEGRSAIQAAARAVAAIELGRIDPETSANIGTISGGTAANVVPERCAVAGEVRSIEAERVDALVTEIVDRFQDAADASECDLDITVERMFKGYRAGASEGHVALAERALRACGYVPRQIVTGGGSDANALEAKGFRCANLANGTERNHEPGERVAVDALEGMLNVALALVHEAGRSHATDGGAAEEQAGQFQEHHA